MYVSMYVCMNTFLHDGSSFKTARLLVASEYICSACFICLHSKCPMYNEIFGCFNWYVFRYTNQFSLVFSFCNDVWHQF